MLRIVRSVCRRVSRGLILRLVARRGDMLGYVLGVVARPGRGRVGCRAGDEQLLLDPAGVGLVRNL